MHALRRTIDVALIVMFVIALGCSDSQKENASVEPNVGMIDSLQQTAHIKLDASAKLLYHNVDDEGRTGLEEWVIYSAKQIEAKDLGVEVDPLVIANTKPLVQMLTARIKSLKVDNPIDSIRFTWVRDSNRFTADVLRSSGGNYLLIARAQQ